MIKNIKQHALSGATEIAKASIFCLALLSFLLSVSADPQQTRTLSEPAEAKVEQPATQPTPSPPPAEQARPHVANAAAVPTSQAGSQVVTDVNPVKQAPNLRQLLGNLPTVSVPQPNLQLPLPRL